jgi:hypothetical protein
MAGMHHGDSTDRRSMMNMEPSSVHRFFRWMARIFSLSNAGLNTSRIVYAFPASARADAIAVVVEIDGEFLVERLAASSIR